MHPNPAFHSKDHGKDIAFARARGFGMLAISVDGPPLLSHVPFLLAEDGGTADLHLVRSNPIARALTVPLTARLAVTGADSYVSPDWYGVPDQVPTWNYVAVQLTGRLERLPETEMRAMLDRQSAAYEARLLPKTPWTTAKMTPEVLARLMRAIPPCRFHVEDIAATWKLGQNKPAAVRMAAADHAKGAGLGSETAALAALMRAPPDL
ncbi:FMN-binding negative transcriptional regulator [Thalassococcus sp. BH17M4-6]|uniref:FMN-binding negative transcriptional regulator n=1 Tax=Thalassococcus sp. BH17M4-6 TaxID=3413148 RepID=UPI003BC01A23